MSDINLTDVNSYFIEEAKAGRITAAMFRTWSDSLAGTVRRNEHRGKRSSTSAAKGKKKGGKAATSSSSGSDSKGKGSKEKSKKETSKTTPKTKIESKAEKADKLRMSGLVKLNQTFNLGVPEEILTGTWKGDARPWLLSEASNDFYIKVNHELKARPSKELLPEGFDQMEKSAKIALVRKLNYNVVGGKAQPTGEEHQLSRSFVPKIQGRTIPKGFDDYENKVAIAPESDGKPQ